MEEAFLYITTQIGELWPKGSPLGCQNSEGCKRNCNTFLVHHLAKRDEVCQL